MSTLPQYTDHQEMFIDSSEIMLKKEGLEKHIVKRRASVPNSKVSCEPREERFNSEKFSCIKKTR